MKSTLCNMIYLATINHYDQYDKGGNPYILHPLAVMHLLNTDDEELQCIAVGHDLLEDTSVSVRTLEHAGYSQRVIDGIVAMTKVKGQSYKDYKAQVLANQDAIRVKMADLQHNSDIRRLKGVTQKDHDRIARYHVFYMELKAALA